MSNLFYTFTCILTLFFGIRRTTCRSSVVASLLELCCAFRDGAPQTSVDTKSCLGLLEPVLPKCPATQVILCFPLLTFVFSLLWLCVEIPVGQQLLKYYNLQVWPRQRMSYSKLLDSSGPFWCSVGTSAGHLAHICMSKCTESLPCNLDSSWVEQVNQVNFKVG